MAELFNLIDEGPKRTWTSLSIDENSYYIYVAKTNSSTTSIVVSTH